jgi:hypothetical protein
VDYNNFDNKEDLGHGIKGDVKPAAKNSKNEKKNMNNKDNNLRSDKNFNND